MTIVSQHQVSPSLGISFTSPWEKRREENLWRTSNTLKVCTKGFYPSCSNRLASTCFSVFLVVFLHATWHICFWNWSQLLSNCLKLNHFKFWFCLLALFDLIWDNQALASVLHSWSVWSLHSFCRVQLKLKSIKYPQSSADSSLQFIGQHASLKAW